jgi:hypothetical protein
MISKVKSQGKRTVELRVVGRALRLATHAFQFTSTPGKPTVCPTAFTSRIL